MKKKPQNKKKTNKQPTIKRSWVTYRKFIVFALIFAAIGSYAVWRSMAASAVILFHEQMVSSLSQNASVLKDTRTNTNKKNLSVIRINAPGHVVLRSSKQVLDAGVYRACPVASSPNGTSSLTLTINSFESGVVGTQLGTASSSVSMSESYNKTGCVNNIAISKSNSLVQARVAVSGSPLNLGSVVLERTGDVVAPPSASIKPLTPGTSWQWQLTGNVNTTILDKVNNPKKMYDIDVYDTPASTIAALKAKNIVVICYFSAGSSENWRPDYNKFPSSVQGRNLDGWPGEKWLDIRQTDVLMPIMESRMDEAKRKGCDGVEPDNVDAYTNNTGFPLRASDQLNYLTLMADAAHSRNLSIGLKNNIDQVSQLSELFDWALNEQCYQYNECGVYSAFTSKNKAVFGVEYEGSISSFCPKANAANYDWLFKDLDLGATPRTACRLG